MENNKGHRAVRMSRRLLIVCVLAIALLAMSGISYAATGRTITEHVKFIFSDGQTKDVEITTVIDEAGEEMESAYEVDEVFALDENGEGGVRIEGDGWDFETGFYNPETSEGSEVEAQEGEDTPEEASESNGQDG